LFSRWRQCWRQCAHHVALRACEHKFLQLQVIGLIALQPFFGGEERTESETRLDGAPALNMERTDWFWKAILPEGSDRDHAAVNVFGPNSVDISGMEFPATIMFVGGFDPLQDWQKKYYEGLKRSGKEVCLIEYPNAIHSFYGFPELPESSLMIKEVRDFMQKQSRK
jgi:acetyl esterase/lipase